MGKPRVERPGAFFFVPCSAEGAPRLRTRRLASTRSSAAFCAASPAALRCGASVEHLPGPLRVRALVGLLSLAAPLSAEASDCVSSSVRWDSMAASASARVLRSCAWRVGSKEMFNLRSGFCGVRGFSRGKLVRIYRLRANHLITS